MSLKNDERRIIEEMLEICKKFSLNIPQEYFLYIRLGRIVHSDCFFKINKKIYESNELNSSDLNSYFRKEFGNLLFAKAIELDNLYEQEEYETVEIIVTFDGHDTSISKSINRLYKSYMGINYFYNQWLECEKYKCSIENCETESFEEELNSWLADMIDICNEYSIELSDNIYIYMNDDGSTYSNHGYKINGVKYTKENIEKSGVSDEFDVSENIFGQIEEILDNDYRKIEVLFKHYNREMPKQIFIDYDVKNNRLKTDFKYEASVNPEKTYLEFFR